MVFIKRLIVKLGVALIDAMTDIDVAGQLAAVVAKIFAEYEAIEAEKDRVKQEIKDLNKERAQAISEIYAQYDAQFTDLYEMEKGLEEQSKKTAKQTKTVGKVLG